MDSSVEVYFVYGITIFDVSKNSFLGINKMFLFEFSVGGFGLGDAASSLFELLVNKAPLGVHLENLMQLPKILYLNLQEAVL